MKKLLIVVCYFFLIGCQSSYEKANVFYINNKNLMKSQFFDSTSILPFRGQYYIEKFGHRFAFKVKDSEIIFNKNELLELISDQKKINIKENLINVIKGFLKLEIISLQSQSIDFMNIQISEKVFLVYYRKNFDVFHEHPFFRFNTKPNTYYNLSEDCLYIDFNQ